MSIGERIKFFRKQSKLTQDGLAKRTNLSRSYIADIERDRYNPSFDTLKSISKALGISIGRLSNEENENEEIEGFDEETRAIARDIQELKVEQRGALKSLIDSMKEKGKKTIQDSDKDE